MSEHVWATDRCPDCAAKDAEIERFRAVVDSAAPVEVLDDDGETMTLYALDPEALELAAPPDKETP